MTVLVWRMDQSDNAHLTEILNIVPEVHAVIYFYDLRPTRMLTTVTSALMLYAEIGIDWNKTVFALTFADCLTLPPKIKKLQNQNK